MFSLTQTIMANAMNTPRYINGYWNKSKETQEVLFSLDLQPHTFNASTTSVTNYTYNQ